MPWDVSCQHSDNLIRTGKLLQIFVPSRSHVVSVVSCVSWHLSARHPEPHSPVIPAPKATASWPQFLWTLVYFGACVRFQNIKTCQNRCPKRFWKTNSATNLPSTNLYNPFTRLEYDWICRFPAVSSILAEFHGFKTATLHLAPSCVFHDTCAGFSWGGQTRESLS